MDATMGVRTIGVTQPGRKAAIHDPIIPAEIWAANVQAAVEACRGTECMVIARVQHKSTVGGAGPRSSPKRRVTIWTKPSAAPSWASRWART